MFIFREQFLQGPLGQTAARESRILPKIRISNILTLKIEGKADGAAKVYKCICPIFRLDKTSLHQELEKISENITN